MGEKRDGTHLIDLSVLIVLWIEERYQQIRSLRSTPSTGVKVEREAGQILMVDKASRSMETADKCARNRRQEQNPANRSSAVAWFIIDRHRTERTSTLDGQN